MVAFLGWDVMAILQHFILDFCLLNRFDKVEKSLAGCCNEQTEKIVMMALRQFLEESFAIPTVPGWYPVDLTKVQGCKKEL